MYLKCREYFIGVENRVFQHNRPVAATGVVENHAQSIAAYWREAEPQLLASPIAGIGQQPFNF